MKEATVTISLKELDDLRDFKRTIEKDMGYVMYPIYDGETTYYYIKRDEILDKMKEDNQAIQRSNHILKMKNLELEAQLKKKNWYEFWK